MDWKEEKHRRGIKGGWLLMRNPPLTVLSRGGGEDFKVPGPTDTEKYQKYHRGNLTEAKTKGKKKKRLLPGLPQNIKAIVSGR